MSRNAPAFPSPVFAVPSSLASKEVVVSMQNAQGMTLRDYFAAAAIHSSHVASRSLQREYPTVVSDDELNTLTAEMAYAVADAMLEQREKVAK